MDELIVARHDEGDINRLIGELYESASNEAAWHVYCGRLAGLLEAELLGLHLMSPATGKANLYHFPASEKIARHVDGLAKQNLLAALPDSAPDQLIFSSSQGVCQVFHKEGGQQSVLLLKPDQEQPLSPVKQQLLSYLMPHLQRAFSIFQRFSILSSSGSVLINLLDCLQVPALVSDGDGRVHYQNKLAKKLISDSLYLPSPSAERRMGHLLPSVMKRLLASEGRAVLQQGDVSLYSMMMGDVSSTGESLYLILADDPDQFVSFNDEVMKQLYGVSKSEALLCTYIMKGLSLAEIADSLFKSEHTVKTQLKRIYKKTQCSSRSELVRLLFLSPARWMPRD